MARAPHGLLNPKNFRTPEDAAAMKFRALLRHGGPIEDVQFRANGEEGGCFTVDTSDGRERNLVVYNADRKTESEPDPNASIRDFARSVGVPRAYVEGIIERSVSPEQAREEIIRHKAESLGMKRAVPLSEEERIAREIVELEDYFYDPDGVRLPDQKLFRGLTSKGGLAIWGGDKKHRKSTTLYQLAVSAAVGRDFLCFRFEAEKPLRVVILDYETDSEEMDKRRAGVIRGLDLRQDDLPLLKENLSVLEVKRYNRAGKLFPFFPHDDNQSSESLWWKNWIRLHPADLYIMDPLRMFFGGDENDSKIIMLALSRIRRFFGDASVIIAHHMRKLGSDERHVPLIEDMRRFADNLRGSGALTDLVDVIALQERVERPGRDEEVHIGAFMKRGADVQPFRTIETGLDSYTFKMVFEIPALLDASYAALKTAGGKFPTKSAAVEKIKYATKVSEATAYRHVDAMIRLKLLVDHGGGGFSLVAPDTR
jgi:AAA domain